MPKASNSKSSQKNQQWALVAVAALVVLAAVVFYHYNYSQTSSLFGNQNKVSGLVMAKGVDAQANPVNPTSSFTTADHHVYMVATVNNATTSDKLTYVRYLNGQYVDSAQASPSQNGVHRFFFDWNKDQTSTYPAGVYLIKLYDNGNLEDAVAYTVQ